MPGLAASMGGYDLVVDVRVDGEPRPVATTVDVTRSGSCRKR
jgi:uncharacterized protein with GYD domain